MEKKGRLHPYLGGVAGFFLFLGLFGLAQGTAPFDANPRADIIRIDLTAESGVKALPGATKKQMPAVDFYHDRHTRALEGDTCRACHLTQDDRMIFLFKRLATGDLETEREIYHAGCIGCHAETAAAARSSGPLSGNCRGCHSRNPEHGSVWVPLAFTPSLHYRHESTDLIPPDPATRTNCSACHHQYDPALQTTTYITGEENSCYYCHPAQTFANGRLTRPHRFEIFKPSEKPIRLMSAAAHDGCVACHRQLSLAQSKPAGPQDCAGCHTVEAQAAIKVLETVPRLKRNQPDTVLMGTWLDRDDLTPQTIATEVDPVPFDHKAHEGYTGQSTSCRHCHHSSLKACSDCHTRPGSPEGDRIGLHQAMHGLESEKTCMGCHLDRTVTATDCAGCHTVRPQPVFQDQSCRHCHGVDRASLPAPPLVETARADLAAKALQTRRSARKSLGSVPRPDQIPERVRIDVLVETYEAVDMPHRKIIQALDRGIQNSPLAQTFHPDPLTMCAGCHHHSPADLKPPKCASCHSPQQTVPGDGRPALMAAYHIQCMGCHQQMEIARPQATACLECHPKRQEPQAR